MLSGSGASGDSISINARVLNLYLESSHGSMKGGTQGYLSVRYNGWTGQGHSDRFETGALVLDVQTRCSKPHRHASEKPRTPDDYTTSQRKHLCKYPSA